MTLNRTQKTIIVFAIFCFAAMILYPPWVLRSGSSNRPTTKAGPYAFIWVPPEGNYRNEAIFIDLYQLSAQLVGVLVLAIGLCLVCHNKKH